MQNGLICEIVAIHNDCYSIFESGYAEIIINMTVWRLF